MAMTQRFKYCVLLPLVLVVTAFLLAVPTGFFGIDGLTVVQQRVIALFVFAALMWMTEIIPNWTTSLLVVVLALLTVSDKGIGFLCDPRYGQLVDYKHILSCFADPVVMLFLGGFVLAIVAEEYGLDVTLARVLLKPFGKRPRMVLLGFLLVISIFSMFMSNTATAAMMIPIMLVVARGMSDPSAANQDAFLALGGTDVLIAFVATCASLAMVFPISTPPNAIASSTGLVRSRDMARMGLLIGLIGFVFGFFWMTKIFPF